MFDTCKADKSSTTPCFKNGFDALKTIGTKQYKAKFFAKSAADKLTWKTNNDKANIVTAIATDNGTAFGGRQGASCKSNPKCANTTLCCMHFTSQDGNIKSLAM